MANDKTITRPGFQLIVRSGTVSKLVREAIDEGLNKVGQNYYAQIIKNISLSDHSLEDLRKLQHPYSTDKPDNSLHGDDSMVHIQSGALIKSIQFHPMEETTTRRFSVYISSDSPYIKFLIYGTTFMRPRNFPQKAFDEIKDSFWKPLIDSLSRINYRIEGTGGVNSK